jgi:sialic acid synthase SpsE
MPIEIIGEIGVNHNGNFVTACRLVDAAMDAGCTAVKTQLFDADRVYAGWPEHEMMRKLQFGGQQMYDLKQYCDQRSVELIVTPDEIEDAVFLKSIGVKRIKTSSQDVTNLPFLRAVCSLGLPVIFSTGASNWDDVFAGLEVLSEISKSLTVMHCVSAYPTPLAEMNLKVIRTLAVFIDCVGLSDHTEGNEAAMLALALGATVFEKHITLDKNQDGPDHAASATPDEMWEYVQALKRAEAALGDGIKRVMPCEIENRKRYERFIAPRLKENAR